MIASLPMYWRAETADHWRDFWSVVQDHCDLPDLTSPEELPSDWHDHWLDPKLALSMTCGLPLRSKLKGRVTYVGTLDFGLPCDLGFYHSVVISKARKLARSPRLAFNALDSQSGWAATQSAAPFSKPPKFTDLIETGSHAASLAAVADGSADVAYVDAVTWRLLKINDPRTKGLHVLGATSATPGLPLITAMGRDPKPLRDALSHAVKSFSIDNPFVMGGPLDFTVLDEAQYFSMELPQAKD